MKTVALLLLLQLPTPRPIDPTVATCQELVFTPKDEVGELILQIQDFAREKRASSVTAASERKPIQVIPGNKIQNLKFDPKEEKASSQLPNSPQ